MRLVSIVATLLFFIPAHSQGVSSPESVVVPTAADLTLPVATVHLKKTTGLDVEAKLNRDSVRIFRDHARDYVRFRQNKISAQQVGLLPAQCQDGQPLRNPYCAFVSDDWKMSVLRARYENDPSEAAKPGRVSKGEYEQLVHSLKNSEFDDLGEVSEQVVRKVMRVYDSPEDVLKLADGVLNESKCPPPNVLLVLGMKLEEFFPDRKFMDEAIKVFSRADQCTKTNDPTGAKIRYRLGLVHLLDESCAKAEPIFRRLSEFRADDGIVSRAYYWLGKCAQSRGHRLHVDLFRNRILKWNPLGFHTSQLFDRERRSPLERFLLSAQPDILLRSQLKPELNPIVRAVEAIQETDAPHLAREMLTFLKVRSSSAEPEFQFYVGLLCERSKDYIGKFQLLSRVFRQQPQLISEETLRIFYPLRQWERVKSNPTRVDPFLIISLIRQESGFNEQALSPVGAVGLMQLMPNTARKLGVHSRKRLYEPDTNLRIGIRYFESLVNRFEGDSDLALAAYNAGPERVEDWRRRYPTQDRVLFMDLIPFNETRNYVALIGRNYFWYQHLYMEENPASESEIAGVGSLRVPAGLRVPKGRNRSRQHR